MHSRLVCSLATLSLLVSSTAVAQPPKHPEAEKALARIVLDKDFGDELKFHSRQVVTMAQNDRVPGLNGLMFMRWKGDDPGTEVTASVQWFAKKEDLLAFYAQSNKREDYRLGEFDGKSLWKIDGSGYSWTDGEHFLVSLGGSPAPPPEMVKAWLVMIASEVAEVEADALHVKIEKAAVRYTRGEFDGVIELLEGLDKEIDALAAQYPKKKAKWMPGVLKSAAYVLLAATYRAQNELEKSGKYEALFKKPSKVIGQDVDFDECLRLVLQDFGPEVSLDLPIQVELQEFEPRDIELEAFEPRDE